MLITCRKDRYRGLVTLRVSKLRECAKYEDPFICDCGCSFFREDTRRLNMVRCNSCKVWHRLELHDDRLEGILADMDRRFRERKNRPGYMTCVKPDGRSIPKIMSDVSEGIHPVYKPDWTRSLFP